MAIRSSSSRQVSSNPPDPRGQMILAALINEHLLTGDPVGSRTLSDRLAQAAGWSSATIRNAMGELEDAGFVEQPHTSAGRIPTDKGYRFYVDHMPRGARLSKTDLAAINSMLGYTTHGTDGGANRLMERISRALSSLSENVGIVVSPSLADNRLQHIEFVHVAENRILVILITTSNIIHNKIIRIDEDLSQEELERTARYLNAEFSGKSLLSIRAEILELMSEEKALYDSLLRNAMMLCEMSLEGEENSSGDVYVDGASNILSKPEFADVDRMRELFRTFEEKSRLVKILNQCIARDASASGGVQVVIGREHVAPSMQNCALITAPYRIGDGQAAGAIGVVGPVRIEYARMMAVVSYIARLIERKLAEETALA
jgi:heat-inducible transcriptional repressor